MTRKKKRIVRIIAITLAILLAGSAIFSVVYTMANAEEMPVPERNQIAMKIEYMENEQALRITQRLVYTNTSDSTLDHVEFMIGANVFRRSSALFYDSDTIGAAFPYGYLPGGVDITSVKVDEGNSDWGFSDTNETVLYVACDTAPGAQHTFEFDYYLLLTQNSAFLGIGTTGWRLSNFYFAPLCFDDGTGTFLIETPVSFTRWVHTPAADFDVLITIPDSCRLSASGTESIVSSESAMNTWQIRAENMHDLSIVFGAQYKAKEIQTDSGVTIRCTTSASKKSDAALNAAREAIETCEELFGAFPFSEFEIIETDYAPGYLSQSGCLWISAETLKSKDMTHIIRYAVAQQYFGFTAYAEPGADAWLSDSISEYVAYLITDRIKGHDAYLRELNEGVVPSLQYTIPGGFVVTSDAGLLSAREYAAIIRDRGAAVFHEMSIDMGMDGLIAGLRAFYELGRETAVLTEMDLVRAFDSATSGSWENALTDWVFHIGDYTDQSIDWLD